MTLGPADLMGNNPQAAQTDPVDSALLATAQNMQADHDNLDERLSAVAQAVSSMPQIIPAAHTDPAGASATITAWIRGKMQGDESYLTDPNKVTALVNAYKSVYGERPSEAQGGRYDQQQYMQWLASQRGDAANLAAGFSHGMANVGLAAESLVAPGAAEQQGASVPVSDTSRVSGQAGEFSGNVVGTLPLILTPGAATAGFAALGAGSARQEVQQRQTAGQQISGGQEALYAGTTGLIQGVLGHFLGHVAGGNVPLGGVISKLSPDLVEALAGPSGPAILSRAVLNAGTGAGVNESLMASQELAKKIEGINPNDWASVWQGIKQQTPETLAEGGIQGAGMGVAGEIARRVRGNEAPQPAEAQRPTEQAPPEQAAPEQTAPQENVRPATESNPFAEEAPAEKPPVRPITPELAGAIRDQTGMMMPTEPRLADNPEFMQHLEEQKRQIAESDRLLAQVDEQTRNAPEPLKGALPEDAYDHPAVQAARAIDPTVKVGADLGEHGQNDLIQELQASGKKVIPISSEKIGGFVLPSHPDTILFNVATPVESAKRLLIHEWAHGFFAENPDAAKALVQKLPAVQQEKIVSEYMQKMGPDQGKAYLSKPGVMHDEIFAGMLERMTDNERFRRAVTGEDGTLWQKIKDFGEKFLNQFSAQGRLHNEVIKAIRESTGMTPAISRETPAVSTEGSRQAPRGYLDIGHQSKNKVDLFGQDEEGNIQTVNRNMGRNGTHMSAGMDEFPVRGRIDHTKQEISITARDITPESDRQAEQTARTMQKKYPSYDVYVAKGSTATPLHELEGRLSPASPEGLLPTLKNIRHDLPEDKPVGERVVDALNAISPPNSVKFARNVESGMKKLLLDRNEPIERLEKSTPPGFVSKISELSLGRFIRTIYGYGRYEKMTGGAKGNEFAGLRDMQGNKFQDPKTKGYLTRYWLLDPVAQEATKGKTSSKDILKFADNVRVAESTIERHGNRIKYETAQAAKDKLAKIMDSLPAGQLKEKFNTISTEGEPSEFVPFDQQTAEKEAAKELAKTRKKISAAKQLLADFQKVGESESANKTPGEAKGGRGTPPPSELLAKAQERLTLLDKMVGVAQNGGELTPGDILNREDINKINERAGKMPISGIGKNEKGESTGKADVAEANKFLADAKKAPLWDVSQEYNRRNRLWENSHLQVAVESGLLSKKQANDILNSNQRHADFHRVMEEKGFLPALTRVESGQYYKARGSNREIDMPTANTLQTTERIYRAADENLARRMVIEHATATGAAEKVAEARADTITVKEDGEKVHYRVDPEIAQTVDMWGRQGITLPKAVRSALRAPGLLKLYANILSPVFSATHLVRQTFNRVALSPEGGTFNLEGIAATMKMFSPKYKRMLDTLNGTMGGASDFRSASEDYHKIVRSTLAELDGKPNTLVMLAKKAWHGYSQIGEWSDAANRVAEFQTQYKRAKANGMSEGMAQQYAAARSRELCDFAVAGTLVKALNELTYVPFVKAEMQGVRRMYDLARSNPALAAQRAVLYGLLPALAPVMYAMSQGKKALNDYLDRDITHRTMYSIIRVGQVDIFVPVGQSMYPAKALVELLFDKHPDAARLREAVMASGIIPRPALDTGSLLPFSGVREANMNYDPFFGKNIVPPEEDHAALDLRHIDSASSLSQMISKVAKAAGMELDPRKIDHVMSQDIGGLANVAQSVSDLGKPGLPAAQKAALIPGYVRTPPAYTAESVQTAVRKAQYLEDTASPQYKAMQAAIGQSYEASDMTSRNDMADKARASAEDAIKFYAKFGDDMLKAKQVTQAAGSANQEYKSFDTFKERADWLAANPVKARLVREEQSLAKINSRIGELRKLLVKPELPDDTQQMAERELTRLYGLIQKMQAQP